MESSVIWFFLLSDYSLSARICTVLGYCTFCLFVFASMSSGILVVYFSSPVNSSIQLICFRLFEARVCIRRCWLSMAISNNRIQNEIR